MSTLRDGIVWISCTSGFDGETWYGFVWLGTDGLLEFGG
jgi:hypothetical protein